MLFNVIHILLYCLLSPLYAPTLFCMVCVKRQGARKSDSTAEFILNTMILPHFNCPLMFCACKKIH